MLDASIPDLAKVSIAAFSIGFGHTVAGPDHYVPFVAMSRVGDWSARKTFLITTLCGIGHVGSSVVLGMIGVAFGLIINQLTDYEEWRGNWAGWLLTIFGAAYFLWGLWFALTGRTHRHLHAHVDGTMHTHDATDAHALEETHPHAADARAARMTPWILMTIFVFGPCEPLIPMMMEATTSGVMSVLCVVLFFSLATLGAMLTIVMLMYYGTELVAFKPLERYGHAIAGLIVLACGLAIQFGL